MAKDEWMDLYLGSSEERSNVNKVFVEAETQERIENLIKATFVLNHIVNFNAKCISDQFKAAREKAKADPNASKSDKRTSFRLRVRMSAKHTLMAEWYRAKMSFGSVKFDNQSRGGKYSYSARTFYGQPRWLQDFARDAEAQLEMLRKQNDMLFIIRKNLYELSKMVAEYHRIAEGNGNDVVSPKEVSKSLSAFFVPEGNNPVADKGQTASVGYSNVSVDEKKSKGAKRAKDAHDARRVTGDKIQALLNLNYPELARKKKEEEEENDLE